MKTRIQIVGGEYGVKEGVLWKGDLPLMQNQLQIALLLKDETKVFKVSQVALEIDIEHGGDYEQVIYVLSVDRKSEALPLMG